MAAGRGAGALGGSRGHMQVGEIEAQLPKRPPEERPRARPLGPGCPATVRLTHRASPHNSTPEPGQRRGWPSEGRAEGTSRGQSQAPAGGPGPAGMLKEGRSLAARGLGGRASSSGHSGSWAMAGRGGPMGGTCGYCPLPPTPDWIHVSCLWLPSTCGAPHPQPGRQFCFQVCRWANGTELLKITQAASVYRSEPSSSPGLP